MGLTAIVRNSVLLVSGQATASGASPIRISAYGDAVSVLDNGAVEVEVPIVSDGSAVRAIDVRGLQSARASISTDIANALVYGSAENDYISTAGGGRNRAYGEGGDDFLSGYNGIDQIYGGAGNDTLHGAGGNDLLSGGRGNDLIDGGEGFDVASYSGKRSDYRLDVANGVFILTDLRRGGAEGIDTIANVEQLKFSDGLFDMPAAPTSLTATVQTGVLSVSGQAAIPGAHQVDIRAYGGITSVLDNGTVEVQVPIGSDGSIIHTIDGRSLKGSGASIVTNVASALVYGGAADDYILTEGGGKNRSYGGGGDDFLEGYYGIDQLYGGDGNDTLNGAGGNDVLNGGRGNDLIDGGEGFDVASYAGKRSDYRLDAANGVFTLTDLRRGGAEGIDTIANVEQLKFSDGLFDMPAAPTSLRAAVQTGMLTVSGVAASTSRRRVDIVIYGDSSVHDNGEVAVQVPITGDGSSIHTIDARGMQGAGVSIVTNVANALIYGSSASDYISTQGGGRNRAYGEGGDDFLSGYKGIDQLYGGAGNDTLHGEGGNDILNGGRGNDLIDGGAGFDVASYAGKRSDYRLDAASGVFTLTDLRRGGAEGIDTIANVEQLKFSDGQFALTALLA